MAPRLGSAGYSHSVRMRVGLAGFLVCATLASCTRWAPEPRPTGTLEPTITQSSVVPTADKNNVACTLLTKKDRFDLVGYSMDAEVPVRPDPGTEECVWVRSLNRSARAAIRVVAFSTPVWSRQIVPQVQAAIVKPSSGKALRRKLQKALAELIADRGELSGDRACEIYVLLAKSRGADLGVDQVGYSQIGALPAAFAITCEGGIMTMAGYGEYGIRPSLALNHGVTKLAEAASARAADALGSGDGKDVASDEDSASDEDASPSPAPSPRETGESDSDRDTS